MTDQAPGADDLGFELVPPNDDVLSPEDDLNAAAASALDDPTVPVVVDGDAPEPFGVSWLFDWSTGRFLRHGQSPARVSGTDALIQWCMMALNSARYAHPVFSDEFGIEKPLDGLGSAGALAEEFASDWGRKTREALLVHDRIVDVSVTPKYDPVEGVVVVDDLVVVTDEDVELPFPDLRIALTPEG